MGTAEYPPDAIDDAAGNLSPTDGDIISGECEHPPMTWPQGLIFRL
jgi:hypothetical protein